MGRTQGGTFGRESYFPDEPRRPNSLLENWRRGPPGGYFTVRHPLVGTARSRAAATQQEPVSPLLRRRRKTADTRPISAQGSRLERGGHCPHAEARRAGFAGTPWSDGGSG